MRTRFGTSSSSETLSPWRTSLCCSSSGRCCPASRTGPFSRTPRCSSWRLRPGRRRLKVIHFDARGPFDTDLAVIALVVILFRDGLEVEHELAQRQAPRALQHLALDLEPVAEQDHHQGDHREVGVERSAGVEVDDLQPAVAEHEARDDEQRGEREEGPVRDARQQRPEDEQHGEHEDRRVEVLHGDRVSDEEEGSEPSAHHCPGKSPSWQDIDGACSGYLIEDGDTALLLDCGNGVFSKLRRFIDYVDVDAVVLSHLHADHFLDLVPFSYALTYAPRQQPVPVHRWNGTDDPAHPVLHAPPARATPSAASAVPGGRRT